MSFLNPFFLIGLSALAIPILIHLVKRERAPKIYFSSLRFLRPISQRTLKYLRLQNLLLMLLRMLALLLMVFAFARPYFHTTTPLPPPTARARALAILVDNSMSMGYADHLARAKRKATELVDKISALFGLNHGIITLAQYSHLVAAVIGSAVIPTMIANAWFMPRHLLPDPTSGQSSEAMEGSATSASSS